MTPEEKLRKMFDRTRAPEQVDEREWRAFASAAKRSLRTQRVLGAGAFVVVTLAVLGAVFLINGDTGSDVGPIAPDPSASVSPKDIKVTLTKQEVWFVNRETSTLSWAVHPVRIENDQSLRAVLEELLDGPRPKESEAGITTDIPEGTRLLKAPVENGIASIDLSREFMNGDQPSGYMELREAQVVFTTTQFPEVHEVQILVEGEPYSDDSSPTTRRDYDKVAAPIVVEEPRIGTSVPVPLRIVGTANVFEGTVIIEIDKTEEDERPLQTFTTATCGSGCRGEFSKTIEMDIDEPTPVELRVYEESAEDGLPRNMISLPLTLVPEE